MNREILFRGKRVDNGGWVFGSLIAIWDVKNTKQASFIQDISGVFRSEVYPATVGQYTGLTDSKGNKVFEGDIVKGGIYTAYKIKWDSYRAEFNTGAAGLSVSEVIGTIHDTHLTKQS